ncbi:MAG: Do family serine endopeptidase [Alphaproteobacteria bacterium]|nr:Do family serine endopeptidase [Alphaproteobacteria bacterium]
MSGVTGTAFFLFVFFCFAFPAASQTRTPPQSQTAIQLSFAPIVKKAAPAVVNINGKRKVVQRSGGLFDDPFFQRFFGPGFGQRREPQKGPIGSGVIIRPDGLIVTNNHVIAGSDELTVVFADRREFPAEIIMTDKRTDLAVLRIETGDGPLPYLEMADSDTLQVGDLVLAIGNPFGVGQTVTSGIVSALARTTVGVGAFRFFIQTDAAINPGNSGGALVTLDGQLVGVNSAIYTQRGGGSIGIGFAVPTNMVRTVIHAAEGGSLIRPWLGATGQAVTAELAPSFGLSRPSGVVVNAVYPGGPADAAGIRVGDVITAIGGHEVSDLEALRYRVATQMLDTEVDVSVVRKGEKRRLTLALMAPPEDPPRNETEVNGRNPFNGARLANLSPAVGEEYGADSMHPGVIVLEIAKGSPAARIGLQPGDVVLRINDREIELVKQILDELSKPADSWKISIRRDGRVFTSVISW